MQLRWHLVTRILGLGQMGQSRAESATSNCRHYGLYVDSSCAAGMINQRFKPRSKAPSKRRNVDSAAKTTDQHERNKDFLTEQEVDRRRQAARARRYGPQRPENDDRQ